MKNNQLKNKLKKKNNKFEIFNLKNSKNCPILSEENFTEKFQDLSEQSCNSIIKLNFIEIYNNMIFSNSEDLKNSQEKIKNGGNKINKNLQINTNINKENEISLIDSFIIKKNTLKILNENSHSITNNFSPLATPKKISQIDLAFSFSKNSGESSHKYLSKWSSNNDKKILENINDHFLNTQLFTDYN